MNVRTRTGFVGASAVSLTLMLTPFASAQTFGGGGSYEGPNGWQVQIAGSAQEHNGVFTGAGFTSIPEASYFSHHRVRCLELDDNVIIIIGEVVSGNSGLFQGGGLGDPETGDLAGWVFAIGVQDNGEGDDSDSDRVSSPWWFPPEFAPANPCDLLYFPAGESDLLVGEFICGEFEEGFPVQAAPLLNGNIHITTPGAGASRPFTSSFEGSNIPREEPSVPLTLVSGHSTLLGNYTSLIESDLLSFEIVGFDPDLGLPIAQVSATVTFVAASGAELHAEQTAFGPFDPVLEGFVSVTGMGTVTGGTGRFENATGSYVSEAVFTLLEGDDNDLISGTSDGLVQF